MPTIKLFTKIKAPKKDVFNLSRNIDFHQLSTHKTNEKGIAGRTSGLIKLGETVTWRAKHLGVYQTLTSKITEMNPYEGFTDEMVQGIFKSIKHQHIFNEEQEGFTIMEDIFFYESPLGVLGKIADFIFLKNYLRELLIKRNNLIKNTLENTLKKPPIASQNL